MDDLISRQAAIDFIDAGHLVNPNEPRWSDNEVVAFLQSRPSAQPKKGKWEMKHDPLKPDPFGFFHDIPVCSECGCMTTFREKTMYCPNCGAKMETDHE